MNIKENNCILIVYFEVTHTEVCEYVFNLTEHVHTCDFSPASLLIDCLLSTLFEQLFRTESQYSNQRR